MKNKLLKKAKKKLKKSSINTNYIVEMAEDFMDVVKDAKLYKKLHKK
ncbi:MAG: hypothetical protein ACRC68_16235 [Clostridium sp.]